MIPDVSAMCCERFAQCVSKRRDRGLTIIPIVGTDARLFFVLGFRALSAQDSDEIVGTGAVKVQTACIVGIQHCPWCGQELQYFYSPRVDKLPVVRIDSKVDLTADYIFALADRGNRGMRGSTPDT